MTPGAIVKVHWRDAKRKTTDPNRVRPAVVIGMSGVYVDALATLLVVPMTADEEMLVPGVTLVLLPTPDNGCTRTSYALSWNIQSVAIERITPTNARVTDKELEELRAQVARLVGH
jgi:mRNA interferase MazF